MEAVAVDGGRARDQHNHLIGLAQDRLRDPGADVRGEALRVVEVAERAAAARAEPLEVEAHRRDDEGPREAAASGLVGARDVTHAEPAVVGESRPAGRRPFARPRLGATAALRALLLADAGLLPPCRGGSRAWPG